MASWLSKPRLSNLLLLLFVAFSTTTVEGSNGNDVPVTIYIKPRQPPATAVQMLPLGMTADTSHMTVSAYTLPATQAQSTSNGSSTSSSQMPTAKSSGDSKADATSSPVTQVTTGDTGSDTTMMGNSVTGSSGTLNGAADQVSQQQPASSAAGGAASGVGTTTTTTTTTTAGSADNQPITTTTTTTASPNNLPTTTTTTTTTTTSSSAGSSGTSSSGSSGVGSTTAATGTPSLPPQAGAPLSALSETVMPAGSAAAAAGPLTAVQQPAVAPAPDQAQTQLTPATTPATQVPATGGNSQTPAAPAATTQVGLNGTTTSVLSQAGLQVRNVSGLVGLNAAGANASGSGARATVGAASPAKSASPNSSTTKSSSGTAGGQSATPGQGLQPAFAPLKPSNIKSSAPPQLPQAIPTAFSNISAPPPFLFKQKSASNTVKIGCALPFEGSQKLAGEAIYNALKMAITDLAPKVVPNLNINLTCYNSRCSDIPAFAAVTKLANEGAVAVVGEVCSRAAVAAAGVANVRKIPVISPAATSPSLSQTDFFFRTVPSDRYQGMAAAHLVARAGVRNVAMVYEDNTYGFGLAFNFIAGFTKDGGNVPVVYSFKPTQGNPQTAVAKIKAGLTQQKLDGVFISTSNLTFVADFLVAAKAANLNLKFYGGDSLADYTVLQNINGRPSVLANLTVVSVAPGSLEFVSKYRKFTNNAAYSAYAAHAYDAMDALLRAYKAATPPKDGAMIAQQLGKQKFAGVAGPVEFDKYGDAVMTDKTYAYLNFNVTSGTPILRGFVTK